MKNQHPDIDLNVSDATTQTANTSLLEGGEAQPQALKALAILEKTAPEAHAHLLQCLMRQDGQLAVNISTHLIRPSAYANRSDVSLTGDAFIELKNSIRVNRGNAQPILLRPVPVPSRASSESPSGVDEPLYEIVAGHRRYQACRELGLPVMAIVVPVMSDAELVLAMHHENHARADLTPWETGCMFKQWLDKNLFKSLHDMSRCLGREVSSLSRAVALAKLPEEIVLSFVSPVELQYKDADILNDLLRMNRDAVLSAAKALAESIDKLSRAEVIKKLTLAAQGQAGVGSSNQARKIPLRMGEQVMGQIAWDAKGQARVTITQTMSQEAQQALEDMLAKFFARAGRASSGGRRNKRKETA